MTKKLFYSVATVALFALSGANAEAKSIKGLLSSDQLASLCGDIGVGAEVTAQLSLADGNAVTGSVHCEEEDLVASVDDDDNDNDTSIDDDDEDEDGKNRNRNRHRNRGSDHDDDDDHGGNRGSSGNSGSGSSGDDHDDDDDDDDRGSDDD